MNHAEYIGGSKCSYLKTLECAIFLLRRRCLKNFNFNEVSGKIRSEVKSVEK